MTRRFERVTPRNTRGVNGVGQGVDAVVRLVTSST
jgi:hypothetical protein